jgi:hypothetical protein
VILRELTGHTGHRRMAVDLLSMEALDWTKASCLMSTPPDPVTNLRGQVNRRGIATDDVSRTAGPRTVCNQPAGTHTRGEEWAVVGPRQHG